MHPQLTKTYLEHDFLEEGPFHAVIGLAYVKLGHKAFVRAVIGTLKIMNQLVGDNKVIVDHPPRHEGTLVVTDAMREENFQAVHQHFGYQLIDDSTQANRTIAGHVLRLRHLKYHHQNGIVYHSHTPTPFNNSLQ